MGSWGSDQLFEDEGEAKLLSIVGQHCREGHAAPKLCRKAQDQRLSRQRYPSPWPSGSEGAQHRGDSPRGKRPFNPQPSAHPPSTSSVTQAQLYEQQIPFQTLRVEL